MKAAQISEAQLSAMQQQQLQQQQLQQQQQQPTGYMAPPVIETKTPVFAQAPPPVPPQALPPVQYIGYDEKTLINTGEQVLMLLTVFIC